jgi:tRNA (guanine37-N1)-methyltransferase
VTEASRSELPLIFLTPRGRPLDQSRVRALASGPGVRLLCGRYEGIDERVTQALVTDEISIGDFVLTGGELAALVLVDAVVRLIPGVVGDAASVETDSFMRGLLDHPQFTRPAVFRGMAVPDVLVSGHHGEIERWRGRERVRRTLERRPDLLAGAVLTLDERQELERLTGVDGTPTMQKGRGHEGD